MPFIEIMFTNLTPNENNECKQSGHKMESGYSLLSKEFRVTNIAGS